MSQFPAFLSRPLTRAASQIGLFALPVVATGTSIGISIIAGMERGGTTGERLAWVFVGITLVLCAHLILALAREQRLPVKIPAIALWLCALLGTGYGHGTFFLEAQRHAGDLRAATVPPVRPTVVAQGPRSVADVAADRAKIEIRLAALMARRCEGGCAALLSQRAQANAEVKAFDIELDEARRQERLADVAEARVDRIEAHADALREDPVTSRLASFTGVPASTIDMWMVLSFGWLLEAIASLGWLLALSATASNTVDGVTTLGQPAAASVDARLLPSVGPASAALVDEHSKEVDARAEPPLVAIQRVDVARPVDSHGELRPAIQSHCELRETDSDDLSRLVAGVERGELRATVVEIRQFFSCSQARAIRLRRAFWQMMQDTTLLAKAA